MTDYTPSTDEVRQSFVYAESSDFVATVPGAGVDSWARVPAQGDVRVTRVRNGEDHKAATAEFDRWLDEVERAAAENAVEAFRTELRTTLTAPDPDLSLTVGWQEYLATSMISTLLDEQENPYRKKGQ